MLQLDNIGKGLVINVTDEQKAAIMADTNPNRDRVIRLGISNALMDCHASAVRKDFESDADWRAAAEALVYKSLTKMVNGEFNAKSSTPRAPTDPVGKESARLARVWVGLRTNDAQIKKWSQSFTMPASDTPSADERKAIIAEAIKRYAARPETIADANANLVKIAEMAATVDVEL